MRLSLSYINHVVDLTTLLHVHDETGVIVDVSLARRTYPTLEQTSIIFAFLACRIALYSTRGTLGELLQPTDDKGANELISTLIYSSELTCALAFRRFYVICMQVCAAACVAVVPWLLAGHSKANLTDERTRHTF